MTKVTDVVLVGAGAHAVSVIDLIESTGQIEILGFLEDRLSVGDSLLSYPSLGAFKELPKWVASDRGFLISVGQIGSPGIRETIFTDLGDLGAQIISPVSPHAYVSPRSSVGRGTAVFHGSVINANAEIGDNCIINSQSLVEHDAKIGSHTHVSTGARINGGVVVGERCFIGSGSVVFQECQIPDDSIIPAGAVVKRWPPVS